MSVVYVFDVVVKQRSCSRCLGEGLTFISEESILFQSVWRLRGSALSVKFHSQICAVCVHRPVLQQNFVRAQVVFFRACQVFALDEFAIKDLCLMPGLVSCVSERGGDTNTRPISFHARIWVCYDVRRHMRYHVGGMGDTNVGRSQSPVEFIGKCRITYSGLAECV